MTYVYRFVILIDAYFTDPSDGFGKSGKPKPAPRPKRNVANEYGYTGGLDEEFLFSPRRDFSESDFEDVNKDKFKFSSESESEEGRFPLSYNSCSVSMVSMIMIEK